MSKHYTVAEGCEFTYPADVASLRLVQKAGGVSKLSNEELSRIKFKTVKSGDDCSDMPLSSLQVYLSRGDIIETVSPEREPLKLVKEEVNNE